GWCLFVLSSRRRHTRLVSDWSSDVCSSDLWRFGGPREGARRPSLVTYRRLLRYVQPYRTHLVASGALLIVSTLLGLVYPQVVQRSEERRVGKVGRGRGCTDS